MKKASLFILIVMLFVLAISANAQRLSVKSFEILL